MTVLVPPPPQVDEAYAAALEWARERGYRGDELPRGILGDNVDCPLARAVGGEITMRYWWRSHTDRQGEVLPEEVTDFVSRFDDGCYPDLDELNSI